MSESLREQFDRLRGGAATTWDGVLWPFYSVVSEEENGTLIVHISGPPEADDWDDQVEQVGKWIMEIDGQIRDASKGSEVKARQIIESEILRLEKQIRRTAPTAERHVARARTVISEYFYDAWAVAFPEAVRGDDEVEALVSEVDHLYRRLIHGQIVSRTQADQHLEALAAHCGESSALTYLRSDLHQQLRLLRPVQERLYDYSRRLEHLYHLQAEAERGGSVFQQLKQAPPRKRRAPAYDTLEKEAVKTARQLIDDKDPDFEYPITFSRAARRVIDAMIDRGVSVGTLTEKSVITYLRNAELIPAGKL